MLQRAASNAYSWWWASHIRTKQSKWMEQNLLDMEEKVQSALKLIEEDGDSFARRAEMYYKKRPELIFFVEESYRAYRALAERYDHISTELQNANNTIASVFPEQVEFAMDEEDEESMPKFSKKSPQVNRGNIPKVPKAPTDLKSVITTATKKLKPKKISNFAAAASVVAKSGLGKRQALDEIDKLQKHILSLQTEKEFLKSSYESQLGRYWEIENQIKEMQDRVFNLQDEYGEGVAIEDDEARNLMANTALKSCQESLDQLEEKQERSAEEARTESARINEVRKRLDCLKGELHGDRPNEEKQKAVVPEEVNIRIEEKQKAEELREKIKQQLEGSACLTMTDMAENIDELVTKVISLETAFSSQTALIKQLRSESNNLQTQMRTLEDGKASMIDGNNILRQKLKDTEKKLSALQNLNQKLENEKTNFQSQIIEAHCNLDHLSGKLPSIQQDEDSEPGSSVNMVQLEQPEKLKADEEPKPKALVSMVQVQQAEEVAGVNLGGSGADTDEKLRGEEGSDNPKQMGSVEECQVTDSRRNEEPIIEMKTSPKELESQNLEGKSEEADASSMNRNEKNICPVRMDSRNLGRSSKKLDVSTASRSLKVVDTRDADAAVKSGEVIAQTLSVNAEDNPKKNEADGSATNLVEVVETKANSQHTEGGHEEARVNTTDRSQVEEVQIQDQSQSSKGSYEDSSAESAVKSEKVIAQTLSGSGSATNLVEVVQTKANSEGDREEPRVNTTSRGQVEEVQIQDESKSSKGSNEESDAGNTAKGPEGIVVDLSVGNPEKNDDNGSAGNGREVKVENKKKKMMMKKIMKRNCSEAISIEEEGEELQVVNEVDEPNWQQLFLSGIEDREKALLTEYTITLRNFKDAKKKLIEMDEKDRDHLQTLKQLNELKTVNALKDQEIRSLHHKLDLMQKCFNENRESMDLSAQKIDCSGTDDQKTSKDQNEETKITMNGKPGRRKRLTRQEVSNDNMGFDISKLLIQQPETTTSEIEERLRMRIDELLEENLDFWLKFSATFHQIQQFETGIQDLKTEVTKLQEKGKKQDVSGSGNFSLRSEARPLYKHLREIQNELNIWSEKSGELKEELEDRFSSLCNIQEEITAGLKASAEDDDFSFTSYQAAKFQGEVLNMKQENNKVADELQAALDHIGSLQYEVETNLAKLNEEFRLSGSRQEATPQLTHSESRNRVPLRSFIFGVKPKKQSIFSGMAPVMQKKYYALKAGNL